MVIINVIVLALFFCLVYGYLRAKDQPTLEDLFEPETVKEETIDTTEETVKEETVKKKPHKKKKHNKKKEK